MNCHGSSNEEPLSSAEARHGYLTCKYCGRKFKVRQKRDGRDSNSRIGVFPVHKAELKPKGN